MIKSCDAPRVQPRGTRYHADIRHHRGALCLPTHSPLSEPVSSRRLFRGLRHVRARPREADDNWTVTAAAGMPPALKNHTRFHRLAPPSEPDTRISTARGEGSELSIGKNRDALDPNTVVIVGDDDPATKVSTFELVSGAASTSPSEKPRDSSRSMRPASRQPARAPISRSPRVRQGSRGHRDGRRRWPRFRAPTAPAPRVGPDQGRDRRTKDLNETHRPTRPHHSARVARTDATTPRGAAAA